MQMDFFGTLERLGFRLGPKSPVVVVVVYGERATGQPAPRRPAFNVADDDLWHALRFFDGLVTGELMPGRRVCLPCASADLYCWYRHWCHRTGIAALILPRFAHALKQGGRVSLHRKRFREADGAARQATVAFVRESDALNMASADLSAHVAEFREALLAYECANK